MKVAKSARWGRCSPGGVGEDQPGWLGVANSGLVFWDTRQDLPGSTDSIESVKIKINKLTDATYYNLLKK